MYKLIQPGGSSGPAVSLQQLLSQEDLYQVTAYLCFYFCVFTPNPSFQQYSYKWFQVIQICLST